METALERELRAEIAELRRQNADLERQNRELREAVTALMAAPDPSQERGSFW
jgi:cell division protein FtsB